MARMSIERASGSAAERAALEQLVQFYVYDFAEFLPPERRVGLGEDGRFPPLPHLDEYWTEADRSVWFLRAEGVLCGFALLSRHSYSGLPADFNVGEYFVARPYRRTGIGTYAIVQLLHEHPGVWEIAIGARNLPAQAFWPRAIAAVKVRELQTVQGDGVHWTGPILRFSVAASGQL
jgi:predicted acetyltransferase